MGMSHLTITLHVIRSNCNWLLPTNLLTPKENHSIQCSFNWGAEAKRRRTRYSRSNWISINRYKCQGYTEGRRNSGRLPPAVAWHRFKWSTISNAIRYRTAKTVAMLRLVQGATKIGLTACLCRYARGSYEQGQNLEAMCSVFTLLCACPVFSE
jgi:hypothetical protein